MTHRFLLFFVALMISFLSAQKMSAQGKKLQNSHILIEVRNIQKRFSDSIERYDYKKDAALHRQKYSIFFDEKLKNLKSLYQSIYDKEMVIGKIDPSISFKATGGIQVENNAFQTGITSPEETKSKSVDITEVENHQQLEELRKQLTLNFPTYLMEDFYGGNYRCKLNFIIDVDGKFKKVKYSESSDTEFSIISALFLYAIGGLEKPLLYNKKPIVQNFTQPIMLRFE